MCINGTDRREGDARGMIEVATTERDDARGRGQGRIARAVVGGDKEQARLGSARLGGGKVVVGEEGVEERGERVAGCVVGASWAS